MFGMLGFPDLVIILVLLVLIGAAFVTVLRALGGRDRNTSRQARSVRWILDERYARGESTREKYGQMRQGIETGWSRPLPKTSLL